MMAYKIRTGGQTRRSSTPVRAAQPKTTRMAVPKSKPAASQARLAATAKMKAAMMVGQSQRRRKKPLANQAALVKSAMPKAKAQRSAAEIAAMHAYRASKRKKKRAVQPYPKMTRTKYGPNSTGPR